MMKRLQAARKKMLSIHAHGEKLEPVVGLSPFVEQELDTYENEGGNQFGEGADSPRLKADAPQAGQLKSALGRGSTARHKQLSSAALVARQLFPNV